MAIQIVLLLLTVVGGIEPVKKPKILVVGSANYDTTLVVDRLPLAGETLEATSSSACPGGKGLNQAVAIARLGGEAWFCGSFGTDAAGDEMVRMLEKEGVDTSRCFRGGPETGKGYVVLSKSGQVMSVVVGGANQQWGDVTGDVESFDAILLQREVPDAVNHKVATKAQAVGIPVFLDAGGTDRPLNECHVDWITPNRMELDALVGGTDDEKDVTSLALELQKRTNANVLVTLGSRGAVAVLKTGQVIDVPAVKAPDVVDETAAGDTFRAAFALELCRDRSVKDALHTAACAGAIAVSKKGALPSLPTKTAVDQLLSLRGGGACPWEFASRLNSMKARRDLTDDDDDNTYLGWVRRQGTAKGLTLVDFNYPQHLLDDDESQLEEVTKALKEAGLRCGAVCLRYPETEFGKGALTHPDPGKRAAAVAMTTRAGDWARKLGAKEVVVWPQFDGYDYPLSTLYDDLWDRTVESFQKICDASPDLRISLEFKPTDEKTRFFAIPSTGAACLLARDINRPNFGLTIDVGHCLAAGENPAHSIAMAAKHSKLFGIQLNDWSRFGSEDGLVFGSNHPLVALDVVVALLDANFDGHLYFDTFPRNEDPVRECELNIRRVRSFYDLAVRLREETPEFSKFRQNHDALALLELLEDFKY